MKKNFMKVVAISCASVFISGCFGVINRKPIPSLEDSGILVKADKTGNVRLVGEDGLPYEPCGQGYPIKCPPIKKGETEKVIGVIKERKVDREANSDEGTSSQNLSMVRSANSKPCPRVITIGDVNLVKPCPNQ